MVFLYLFNELLTGGLADSPTTSWTEQVNNKPQVELESFAFVINFNFRQFADTPGRYLRVPLETNAF